MTPQPLATPARRPSFDEGNGSRAVAAILTRMKVLATLVAALVLAACQSSPFDGPSRVHEDPEQAAIDGAGGPGAGAFTDPVIQRELIDDDNPNEDPTLGEPINPGR